MIYNATEHDSDSVVLKADDPALKSVVGFDDESYLTVDKTFKVIDNRIRKIKTTLTHRAKATRKNMWGEEPKEGDAVYSAAIVVEERVDEKEVKQILLFFTAVAASADSRIAAKKPAGKQLADIAAMFTVGETYKVSKRFKDEAASAKLRAKNPQNGDITTIIIEKMVVS